MNSKKSACNPPADQNTALNLKKINSTASRLGLNAIDIPASVETLDIDTIRMRGDSNIHEAVSRTTGISDISNHGAGVSILGGANRRQSGQLC